MMGQGNNQLLCANDQGVGAINREIHSLQHGFVVMSSRRGDTNSHYAPHRVGGTL